MKRIVSCLFVLVIGSFYSLPLYSQTYLNIRYLDGSDRNVPFGLLQKITFDETSGNMNIRLTDATTQTVAFSEMQRLTTDDVASGTLLPVELVAFNAKVNGNTVELSWRTVTEVDNYGFDVERRDQSIEWVKIGFVPGHGNSSIPIEYSFSDLPKAGTSCQYRLRQIDSDGTFAYSDVVNIDMEVPGTNELKQNFPNPFNPWTTIAYKISRESVVTIRIYDVLGKDVASLVNEKKPPGNYEVTFDGSRLASGMYFCKMMAAAYTSLTKMIILK